MAVERATEGVDSLISCLPTAVSSGRREPERRSVHDSRPAARPRERAGAGVDEAWDRLWAGTPTSVPIWRSRGPGFGYTSTRAPRSPCLSCAVNAQPDRPWNRRRRGEAGLGVRVL